LEVDGGIRAFDIYSKRHLGRLRLILVSQESNVYPRSSEITASHQDNFFHFFDPQFKFPGEGEAAVDMLHYPSLEAIPCKSIFTPGCYWKG
jgi:hypothetical protein